MSSRSLLQLLVRDAVVGAFDIMDEATDSVAVLMLARSSLLSAELLERHCAAMTLLAEDLRLVHRQGSGGSFSRVYAAAMRPAQRFAKQRRAQLQAEVEDRSKPLRLEKLMILLPAVQHAPAASKQVETVGRREQGARQRKSPPAASEADDDDRSQRNSPPAAKKPGRLLHPSAKSFTAKVLGLMRTSARSNSEESSAADGS